MEEDQQVAPVLPQIEPLLRLDQEHVLLLEDLPVQHDLPLDVFLSADTRNHLLLLLNQELREHPDLPGDLLDVLHLGFSQDHTAVLRLLLDLGVQLALTQEPFELVQTHLLIRPHLEVGRLKSDRVGSVLFAALKD